MNAPLEAKMANGKFVAYYRVSTQRQGASGLGLEAQRAAVMAYLNGGEWSLAAEFTEVESGRKNNRPELAKALAACRTMNATLVIAKLDRLARNAAFLLSLRDAGVDFVACDLPQADRFTVGILALVAEREADMTSARTQAALAAKKARGEKVGNADVLRVVNAQGRAIQAKSAAEHAANVIGVIEELRRYGCVTLQAMADGLNARGIQTARGGRWYPTTVKNVIDRANLPHA